MRQPLSPLRYPGGKAALGPFVAYLMQSGRARARDYAEPFCGGAGVGLYLLYHEYVEQIFLNDLDERVWSFWHSALFETDEFLARLAETPVTIEEWHEQRTLLHSPDASVLDRGFAAFFLNRTNRSGILNARPIGGLGQDGRWRLDARYKTERLAERIRLLSRYRNRILLSRLDAVEFLGDVLSESGIFVYADPPYLVKGADLYMNAMSWDDHVALSQAMQEASGPWFVTYDDDERVTQLYSSCMITRYRLKHTAGRQRVGTELGVLSSDFRSVDLEALSSGRAEWVGP